MAYTSEDYQREREICDVAAAYAEKIMCEGGDKRKRNFLTKEECAAPEYAACDNAMRGRVEQFEILRDLPEKFVAYLESGASDGIGARLNVTCWPGDVLGVAAVATIGKPNRYGERQRYGRATIGGAVYSWQGQGAGMYATFRKLKR